MRLRRFHSLVAKALVFGCLSPLWAWVPYEVPGLRYPRNAQLARIEGLVVVECSIAEDGTVSRVEVKSGHPVLGKAALENAKTWRFRRSGAANEPSTVQLTFEFRLEGACKTQCCNERFVFRYPDRISVTSEQPGIEPKNSK